MFTTAMYLSLGQKIRVLHELAAEGRIWPVPLWEYETVGAARRALRHWQEAAHYGSVSVALEVRGTDVVGWVP